MASKLVSPFAAHITINLDVQQVDELVQQQLRNSDNTEQLSTTQPSLKKEVSSK